MKTLKVNLQSLPTEIIKSKRVWNKNTVFEGIIHRFSDDTQREVLSFVRERVNDMPLTREEIEEVEYDEMALPNLTQEINNLRPQVDSGIGFVVFTPWGNFSIHESRVASWLTGNAFGETKIQDNEGRRLIEIFNLSNELSMANGARYHDTREGNSPHTDSPQVLNDCDYLCLRCVNDALVGGESILVTADSIYNHLLQNAPEVIETLSGNFYFHCRGVSQEEGKDYFEAPILSIEDGGIRLRFLDHYIREGHKLAGETLTYEQDMAIHYINSVFNQTDLQFRAFLKPGQQVVFANKRMLHARTEFVDRMPTRKYFDPETLNNLSKANRLMDRTWSYKR